MKFPSIIKIPKHQRFNIMPRYYDPVKEDMEQRISRIKQELKDGTNGEGELPSRLSGAFRGRIYQRREQSSRSSLLQFFIMSTLGIGIFGYIYFGEVIFYFLMIAVALYVYLRVRRVF